MKTTKVIIIVILAFVALFLIRECDSQTNVGTQFLYLAGTIAYVGLLIILATKTNLFKLNENEKNSL